MSLNTVRGVNNIGAADAVTKAYIRKNEVFADAFNYFMYDGEKMVLRILNRQSLIKEKSELGFSKPAIEKIENIIKITTHPNRRQYRNTVTL